MNVENLIFYSEPPLNDGADEVRDDVELFSSIRDDEIDSSIMLLECLSGASNRSQDGAGVIDENEHDEELEERLAAINAVDLHEQISTNKPREMQYFSHAYDEGTSFGAMDDETSILLPIVTSNEVPSTFVRSGGLTLRTSSSPTISTVAGSKPHTPRRISLRSPKALTPKRKIGKPFAFHRNGSVGRKGPGHIPFINENEDGEQREPPKEKGKNEENNNDAYILVDGTWVPPLAQEERDEPEPKSEPEPFTSAKNATNTNKLDRRKKTLVETKTSKREDAASPSRLQEKKKDIGSRQRVKITVTDAAAPRSSTPSPTPDPATTPAPIPAASPVPDTNSTALESDSQKSSIATITPTTAISGTDHPTKADQSPMLDGDDKHSKNAATKNQQQKIEDKPDDKSSESIEKLRRVYSRTLEIVKDLSKSEAEHEIIRMLNQNIGRAFGSSSGSAQKGKGGNPTNPTENAKSMSEGIPVATGGPIKKSSIQTTTGKKLNVSFNLSEDIHYFIQESVSSASSRNDFSSSSDGSNGDDVGSSSILSEDHTYDSYSSISTFGADHDACGKVNEILAEIRHIADAFNIFNEDRNSVGVDDFSASTAGISLESKQEQIRVAMSEAFSFRRKANVTFSTVTAISSHPAQNQ